MQILEFSREDLILSIGSTADSRARLHPDVPFQRPPRHQTANCCRMPGPGHPFRSAPQADAVDAGLYIAADDIGSRNGPELPRHR